MDRRISLNGQWMIRAFDGQHGPPESFIGPDADETLFFDGYVPAEAHLDMMCAGLIGDVNVGLNAQAARWVEECVWVYRRTFEAPAEVLAARAAWIVFEGLDLNAVIYLNGKEVARHANAFTPCRVNVAGKLQEGVNTLAVRIESGLYAVGDKPSTPYNPHSLDNLLHKRQWLRKPQYSFSWDWNPRLVNVGLWKPVWLEWADVARIDAMVVFPTLAADRSRATINCRLYIENVTGADALGKVRVRCAETGAVVEQDVKLPSGTWRQDLAIDVADPRLWWPRGSGAQPLYTIEAEVEAGGQLLDSAKRRTGIRSVEIKQPPHPESGRHFIIEINGRPIFAKGGNWVPPDMIYARVGAEKHRTLVRMACEANFNALRVWGGAHFADHAFLDACDEAGIIIWHDFLYACSKYPLDDVDFMNNVKAETTFAVRDLAHHPSLAVWCGNNEIEWGDWDWGYNAIKPLPHYGLFHHIIPTILKNEDPSRPYWPSSPYSPDHEHPNSKTVGDQHPWDVSLGHFSEDFWGYRGDVSRFPNEGGVLGASSPATVRQFLPEGQRRIHSPAWVFHDNAANFMRQPLLCSRALIHWIGRVPENMGFDDYLYYSALLQAEGLKEYADNFRRRMFSSSSAIFWMYNDSWPVSHGWTIVDYYLRRKLAYHPVRRAFQPVSVVPAIESDSVLIVGVNDSTADWRGEVRYGLADLAGGLPLDRRQQAVIPQNSAAVLAAIPRADWDRAGLQRTIVFALLLDGGRAIAQNRLFGETFRNMHWPGARPSVTREGDQAVFASPAFAWGVAIDIDGEAALPDNAFDLLPGIEYRIPWPAERPLPQILRVGNLA